MRGLAVRMLKWSAEEEPLKCLGTVEGEVALVMKTYGEVKP
jgi:hypothetical protein